MSACLRNQSLLRSSSYSFPPPLLLLQPRVSPSSIRLVRLTVHDADRARGMVQCKRPPIEFTAFFMHSLLVDAVDYATEIDNMDIEAVSSWCTYIHASGCEEDFYNLCVQLVEENGRQRPTEPYQALDLFQWLKEQIADC